MCFGLDKAPFDWDAMEESFKDLEVPRYLRHPTRWVRARPSVGEVKVPLPLFPQDDTLTCEGECGSRREAFTSRTLWLLIAIVLSCALCILRIKYYKLLKVNLDSEEMQVGKMGEVKNLILDCGGIIQIPALSSPVIYTYKRTQGQNDTNKESCLWIIENGNNSSAPTLRLKVKVVSNAGGQLYAFQANPGSDLTSEKLVTNKEHELNSRGLYLSFTSNNEMMDKSMGFSLRIENESSPESSFGGRTSSSSSVFYKSSQGTHTVSGYTQVTLVVSSPKNETRFSIKGFGTALFNFNIHEILEMGKYTKRQILSDSERISNGSNALTFVAKANCPVLCLFTTKSDESGQLTDTGFDISWTS